MDHFQYLPDVQVLVYCWIFLEICAREFQESGGGSHPIFLQMHEGPRQLDQSFVKFVIGAFAVVQPEFLEDIVRFVKQLPVETFKITEIMGIERMTPALFNQFSDLRAFPAHTGSI